MSNTQTLLENKVLRALELHEEIKRQQENLDRMKAEIAMEMSASMINELTIPLDELFDVKVKLSERTTKKLDKEELATDLGVEPSVINTKFLLKAVEDRKLSFQRYLGYIFDNINENVTIRKTKASGKKKK